MRTNNWDKGDLLQKQQINGTPEKRPNRRNG